MPKKKRADTLKECRRGQADKSLGIATLRTVPVWLRTHWRHIALSALGLAILATGVLLPIVRTQQRARLDSLLPAEETVALWTNATADDIRGFAGRLPLLAALPPLPSPLDFAVVRLPSGADAWIAAPADPDHADGFQPNARIGHTAAMVSSADVEPLFADRAPRLASFGPYRALTLHTDAGASRAYLRDARLVMDGSDAATLLSAVSPGNASAMLLGSVGKSRVLRLYRDAPSDAAGAPIDTRLASLSPSPTFILALSDPAGTWNRYAEALPPERRAILEAVAAQHLLDRAGKDVSLRYDVLPLLREPASLYVGDGTPAAFLVEGTADADLAAHLSALEKGARSRIGNQRIEERRFDPRFSARIIRQDASRVQEKEYDRGGWHVRMLDAGSGAAVFAVATNRNRFVVSNAAAWLDQVVSPTHPFGGSGAGLALPGQAGDLRAGGWTDPSLLHREDHPALRALAPAAPGPMAWSVSLDGRVFSIATTAR